MIAEWSGTCLWAEVAPCPCALMAGKAAASTLRATPKLNKNPVADELYFCQVTDIGNIPSSDIKHIFRHKHISRTSSQSTGISPSTLK